MQRSELIEPECIDVMLKAVFENEPRVYEAYSKYDSDLVKFDSGEELKNYIEKERAAGENFINVVIHYPSSNGFVEKKEIDLNPDKCKGATKRYSVNGWGLIQLQFDFGKHPNPECRIAVNTVKRATTWSPTYPELKSPELWDWAVVDQNVRRLIRVLRKCA